MTRYGYARVSTDEQNLGRQIDALTVHGVLPEHLHQETASGAAPNRPVLDVVGHDVVDAGAEA
ncbi:recombinase family protein [Brachybacterium epidermidis]|uniref:recombinase family protein n=1 Tax=Brachybacterium epidermidis TaxID=2781983 RepID=UPI00398F07EA